MLIRKECLILVLVLGFTTTFAQSWTWAERYSSDRNISIHSMETGTDGNLLITGIIQDTTIFGEDTLFTNGSSTLHYIAKLSPFGEAIWARSIFIHNGTAQSPASALYAKWQDDQTILLTSQFRDTISLGGNTLYPSEGQMFLAKLDSEGDFIWVNNFGDQDIGFNLNLQLLESQVDSWGNIYLAGTFHQEAYFQTDTLSAVQGSIFVAKFDQNGNEIWVTQAGTESGLHWVFDLELDYLDEIYITGAVRSGLATFGPTSFMVPQNRMIAYLSKLDTAGQFLWTVTGGSTTAHTGGGQVLPVTYGTDVEADEFGNVYLTGFFLDTVRFGNSYYNPTCGNDFCNNFFLAAYQADGNFNWLMQPSVPSPISSGRDLEIDKAGFIYLLGSYRNEIGFGDQYVSTDINFTISDFFVAKVDSNKNCIWLLNGNTGTAFDLTLNCFNHSVSVGGRYTGSGGNLAAAGLDSTTSRNIFIAGIEDAVGCESISANGEAEQQTDPGPDIYPNPFSTQISIDFSSSSLSTGRTMYIFISNLLGEMVYHTITDREQIHFDGNDLSSGMYVVSIYDEDFKPIWKPAKILKVR